MGGEFLNHGPMTEKPLLPYDDQTYEMERSESVDFVETECEGNERLL